MRYGNTILQDGKTSDSVILTEILKTLRENAVQSLGQLKLENHVDDVEFFFNRKVNGFDDDGNPRVQWDSGWVVTV